MASYIQVRLPVYYATLQNDYGLSYTDITQLDKSNRVYVLEVAKADTMKDKGYSNSQILDYYKKQGYSATQVSSIETYLNSRNVKDASTGQTPKDKLTKTVEDIKQISGAVLPIWESIAKTFGIGGNSLTPQFSIPDLTGYKPVSADGYTSYTVDQASGKIVSGTGVDVSQPKINVSSLPFGFTVENLTLFVLILVVIYLYFSSNKQTKSKK